jgi:hypothetical protein
MIHVLHYMTKSMWTPARRTSHFKMMGINMDLVPRLLLQQPPLFWEGFPLDTGTLLQDCFHSATRALMHGPRFVHRGIVMLNQERAFPKLLQQRWKHRIVQNVIAVELRFPFTGTKGPSSNHNIFLLLPQTIIPSPPNVTVGTILWGR